jgi:hypothetical protein
MAGPWEKYQQADSPAPWEKYALKPMQADPTDGMDTTDRVVAGIGRGMTSAGRAVLQGISKLVGADAVGAGLVKQSDIDEAKRLDAPLLNTTAGKVGNVLGNAAIAAPTALIPGVNTYQGAALIGAGLGGLTTEGGLDERLKAAAFGAAGGAAGKGLGDALGAGAKWVANRAADKFATATAANAQKQIAANAMADAGYVIPPADLNPGMVTEALSGLSGKIKTAQVASAKNQPITNSLTRKSLGVADDAPLNIDALQAIRNEAGTTGYAPIRAAGEVTTDKAYGKALDGIAGQYQGAARSFPNAAKNPVLDMVEGLRQQKFDAGDAIDMIKVLRADADKAYRSGDSGLGKASKEAAAAIEGQLERHLKASGNPEALAAFQEARQLIAKTYSVQKALNTQTGDVSAIALAKQLDKGKPLSGDLLTVAQAGQAFPKAMQALKETPKATSPLDWAMGGMSAGMMNPAPAMIAAARPAVRAMLLSGPMQRAAMTGPSAPGLLSTAPAWMLEKNLTRAMMPGLLSGSLSSN